MHKSKLKSSKRSIKYYNIRLLPEKENNASNLKLNKTPYNPFFATFKMDLTQTIQHFANTLRKTK